MTMMICERAKNGKCESPDEKCGHREAHYRGAWCASGFACAYGKNIGTKCVPATPEYVRVVRKSRCAWYRIGERYRIVEESSGYYHTLRGRTIPKSDCEPCEPDNHDEHVKANIEFQKKLKKEADTMTDYEDLRQMALKAGNFHPDTPDRLWKVIDAINRGDHHDIEIPACLVDAMARYIDGERKMRNDEPKKEAKVKYTQIKPISLEKLWDAQPDKQCLDFEVNWGRFMTFISQNDFPKAWKVEWLPSAIDALIEASDEHILGYIWLGYAEHHKFIKKEFEPFDVTIRVESEYDAMELERCMRIHVLPSQAEAIHEQLKAHGIEV